MARSGQLFMDACDEGEALGCLNAGLFNLDRELTLLKRGGAKPNPKLAPGYFRKACELAPPLGCAEMGGLFLEGATKAISEEEAEEALRTACKSDDLRGCNGLGFILVGRDEPKLKSKGISLWKDTCRAGDAYGCRNLGFAYRQGIGVKKDLAAAKRYFRKACTNGDLSVCEGAKEPRPRSVEENISAELLSRYMGFLARGLAEIQLQPPGY